MSKILNDYFDQVIEIQRAEFIAIFYSHMTSRDTIDGAERKIFNAHNDSISTKYFKGLIKQTGIDNLILPHHAVELESGKDPDRPSLRHQG